jgi:hypothetical protein
MGDARYAASKFEQARSLFDQMTASDTLDEFLTLKAYETYA